MQTSATPRPRISDSSDSQNFADSPVAEPTHRHPGRSALSEDQALQAGRLIGQAAAVGRGEIVGWAAASSASAATVCTRAPMSSRL
jgi:hypothetical protein